MLTNKPKLLPMQVPWMISHVPHEIVEYDHDTLKLTIEFIAFFKTHPISVVNNDVYVVPSPNKFRPAHPSERGPYHLVRLIFDGVERYNEFSPYSDSEFIPEDEYDWRYVPHSEIGPENSLTKLLKLRTQYWLDTGCAPDPGFHQILQPYEEPDDEFDVKNYFWLSNDQCYSITTKDWTWELGQAVD